MRHLPIRLFLMATLIVASTTNCAAPSSMLSTGSELLSAMTKNPTLTTVAGLMKTPGLGQYLDSVLKGKFTFLAPTNEALSKMSSDMMGKLSNPAAVSDLANVLKNHIVPGKLGKDDLQKGGLKTSGGKPLSITSGDMGQVIEGGKFNIIPVNKVL